MQSNPARSRKLLFSLTLAAALAACGDDDDGRLSPGLRADLQDILDGAVANRVTPGVVLNVSSGRGETWSAAAGVSDLAGVAMDPGDRFRAGSILKTFVATAVLQAAEAGQLALSDSITEHLPAEVTARIEHAASIQIGMLLAHRSGIPDWVTDEVQQISGADPAHQWTLDEILDQAAGQPAAFPPGEQFQYSNTNYNLLAEILSRVTGRSWRAVVRDQVIARAGLDHTILPEPGDLDCPACAHGYLPIGDDLIDFTRIDPTMAGASGGHALISTAADLSRFLEKLRGGELFEKPSTLAAMFAVLPASDPDAPVVAYGLGVMVLDASGVTAIGHLGGTAGYQSFMFYVPDGDRYVSGAINVNGDIGAVLMPVLQRAAAP